MKITELINGLQEKLEKHGDVEVYVNSHENGFVEVLDTLEYLDSDGKVYADGMVTKKGLLLDY